MDLSSLFVNEIVWEVRFERARWILVKFLYVVCSVGEFRGVGRFGEVAN